MTLPRMDTLESEYHDEYSGNDIRIIKRHLFFNIYIYIVTLNESWITEEISDLVVDSLSDTFDLMYIGYNNNIMGLISEYEFDPVEIKHVILSEVFGSDYPDQDEDSIPILYRPNRSDDISDDRSDHRIIQNPPYWW